MELNDYIDWDEGRDIPVEEDAERLDASGSERIDVHHAAVGERVHRPLAAPLALKHLGVGVLQGNFNGLVPLEFDDVRQ
jgi:hypothetical protein